MALNVSSTVADIVAALDAQDRNTMTETQRWTAVITALYTRIKADMVVTSKIASGQPITATGTDPQGGTVSSTGSNSTNWVGIADGVGDGSIA